MTPGDIHTDRRHDVFCERGVLAAINELADASHSKPMADLISAGKWKVEMLLTLGKIAPPRYAHLIGRYKDDPDASVRQAVAEALGLIDNDAVSVPVLIQLLTRRAPDNFGARWKAAQSLVAIGTKRNAATIKRRLGDLLQESDGMTVTLAARSLAELGDTRGVAKLRDATADGDPRVRWEALLAIGDTTDKAAREVAMRRLADDNLAVRACAIYALGRIGDPSMEPALRHALQQSIEYEGQLEQRMARGENAMMLQEKFGLGLFDLRQTVEAALAALRNP